VVVVSLSSMVVMAVVLAEEEVAEVSELKKEVKDAELLEEDLEQV